MQTGHADLKETHMETKFNSQICTTREQSERLIALGLKKETADMHWWGIPFSDEWRLSDFPPFDDDDIPSWSLHRLMCMIPNVIKSERCLVNSFSYLMNIFISTRGIAYYYEDYDGERIYQFENFGNLMEAAVSAIEWLIKEGSFNKEYLV